MSQTPNQASGASVTPRPPEAPIVGPPPSFDRECIPALEAFLEYLPPSLTPDRIPLLREVTDHPAFMPTDESLQRGGAYGFEERRVPGAPGAPEITLMIFTPKDLDAPAAAIYHTHGGGMVSGTRRSHMHEMLDLAEPLGLVVVSVEYRLAPEHPHPAPIEDCYAGLVWTAENAEELRIDHDRIVVAGASAGGCLAASLALLARDRGGPSLYGQLLACPMLDDRNDTASSLQMHGLGVWDNVSNQTAWEAILGEGRGGPHVSPYASPARANDLSGLPPAYIEVGAAETFRDEAITYASRISQAGGEAELHVWPGGYHAYTFLAPETALSQATLRVRWDWLRRLIARGAASSVNGRSTS